MNPDYRSIQRLLVANRGEIACRVMRSARALGIGSVAVHSDIDRHARHVAEADIAVDLGGAKPVDSYLRGDRIIAAALASGAQAIHPGYGFLSENADFARACEEAGLLFLGPPAAAIDAMGSKSAAKALMEEAGVPLVPGYHGEAQDLETFRREAGRIGYPVLLKAAAGGGGKGMKVVEREAELAEALSSAQREAKAAFGDARMLVEKYLLKPRHVEIQVFADSHGHCLYLNERDCSIQRRHQKVVEEAPAPGLRCGTAPGHGRGRGTRGAGDRLRRRRYRRIPPRRTRPVLLHGNEHPPAGGTPGHRGHHRPRPGRLADPRRSRRGAAADTGTGAAERPRHRSAALRGRPRGRLPPRQRPPGAVPRSARRPRPAGRQRGTRRRRGLAVLRPDAGQADRLGRNPRGSPPTPAGDAGGKPRSAACAPTWRSSAASSAIRRSPPPNWTPGSSRATKTTCCRRRKRCRSISGKPPPKPGCRANRATVATTTRIRRGAATTAGAAPWRGRPT
ncbi:acetyl-CoA carboxylase, biotin carboxylase [Pseudomonas aeruginosa]|nr:acetyl-CoA carboxylase, biotin carboxylase [Pseudomonas aeruginosa]